MKRDVIVIDEDKCNGCGLCVKGCPEGAIQMIDGKARMVNENFCDGLGACIGDCPENAITIEKKEAESYNEKLVVENLLKGGMKVVKAHLNHLREHNQVDYLKQAIEVLKSKNIDIEEGFFNTDANKNRSCPGTKIQEFSRVNKDVLNDSLRDGEKRSELSQWPIQLHLISPNAQYFKNADILIAADCTAFSFGNFHSRFLKGKKLIMFCPKLDHSYENYVDKLASLFELQEIQSITVVKMEVPCCGGMLKITEDALKKSKKIIPIREYTLSLKGEIV